MSDNTELSKAAASLDEIRERMIATPEWTGGPDWAFHARLDRARLVDVLAAVLDRIETVKQLGRPSDVVLAVELEDVIAAELAGE